MIGRANNGVRFTSYEAPLAGLRSPAQHLSLSPLQCWIDEAFPVYVSLSPSRFRRWYQLRRLQKMLRGGFEMEQASTCRDMGKDIARFDYQEATVQRRLKPSERAQVHGRLKRCRIEAQFRSACTLFRSLPVPTSMTTSWLPPPPTKTRRTLMAVPAGSTTQPLHDLSNVVMQVPGGPPSDKVGSSVQGSSPTPSELTTKSPRESSGTVW